MFNIEFQVDGDFFILGKAFLTYTYTTFFLDRKEIWLSQPSEDKFTSDSLKKKGDLRNGGGLEGVKMGKVGRRGDLEENEYKKYGVLGKRRVVKRSEYFEMVERAKKEVLEEVNGKDKKKGWFW